MQLKRVVITGMGSVSPFGKGVDRLMEGIGSGRSAVRFMEGWQKYGNLSSLVAAPAKLEGDKDIPRKKRRSMSPMSIYAVQASQEAVADAGLDLAEIPTDKIGCIIGSTMGSARSITEMYEIMFSRKDIRLVPSTLFFKGLSHSASLNVSQYFGLGGYVMSTSAACASALQALGTGYDLIRLGKQDILLCGGAEEVHPAATGSFDILYAASTRYNHSPSQTPRPFDADRDGLVCGEGSGIILLESLDMALARGAEIYAEIAGYYTCGNKVHISQSDRSSMVHCMNEAIKDAGKEPRDIDYINAHATGTVQGDKAEAEAIKEVFGDSCPVSSLKGYTGHTLGASGTIDLIASLKMMDAGTINPTRNLEKISDDCKGIFHVTKPLEWKIDYLVKNCFAFGGINATLICKKIG